MRSTLQIDASPFTVPPASALGAGSGQPVRWSRRAANGLLAIAVCLAAAIAVAAAFGVRTEVVLTGSMRPTLSPNDMLIVDHISAEAMKVGDIVSFAAPGQKGVIITHRVRRLDRHAGRIAVTTRGDANNTSERWTIASDGHVGRVITTLPGFGVLTQWTGNPTARILIFGLIGLLLVSIGLRWVWRGA